MNRIAGTLVLTWVLAQAAAAQEAPAVIASDAIPVRLRATAHVTGATIRLADVLTLEDEAALPAAITTQPLRAQLTPPATLEVGYDEVLEQLARGGVNASRLVLSGALRCTVHVLPDRTAAVAAPPGERPTARPPSVAPGIGTLADAVRAAVQEEFADTGGEVRVDFERAVEDYLTLASPPFEFDVRSASSGRLGLREFRVRISRDGRVQRTVHVFGRVRLEREVLVAAGPLNLGTYIRPESVTTARRRFDAADDLGMTELDAVVGQRVDRFVAAGEILKASDIRAEDLVQRGKPVTIYSEGAVAVRTSGVALDDGNYGQTVRVRLGARGRGERQVRGTVTGMATVRLIQGS